MPLVKVDDMPATIHDTSLFKMKVTDLRNLEDFDTFVSQLKINYKGIFIDYPEFGWKNHLSQQKFS